MSAAQYAQWPPPSGGDIHWKAPVATAADLPASGNSIGDARVAEDAGFIYVWNGSSWINNGGAGTVTSVAQTAPASILSVSGSPITGAGTLALALVVQNANKVWAGPTTGADANPTFRTLVAADLPAGGDLTDVGTDGIVITGGVGAVIGAGTSIAQHVADSTHNGYLSSTDWSTFNGKQASGNYITALTGDVTATGPGSAAATLATVNSNVGSFGSSTAIPSFTVNGKGLVTAASTNVVIAPAGTLTGTTLASNVVTSSLTSVGTIGTGVWQGTTIAIASGGTGAATTSQNFAFIGPTSGSGAPSFRALVSGDIPSLSGTYLALAGGTMAGSIAMGNNTITGATSISFNGSTATLSGDSGASGLDFNSNSTTYTYTGWVNTSSGGPYNYQAYVYGSGQGNKVGNLTFGNNSHDTVMLGSQAHRNFVAIGAAADTYLGINLTTLTVAPWPDLNATGTTTVNGSTTVTGTSTLFTTQIGVGDQISVSSASGTYVNVVSIASATSLTTDAVLGNGTSQTISVRRAASRWDDRSANPRFLIDPDGNLVRYGSTSGRFKQSVPATITSYAITWPSAQGGASTYLKNDGAGALSWASAAANLAVAAKTANYSLVSTDDAITVDSSGGAITITLPDCATNSGKLFRIKKITSDLNAITITRVGSDTIQDAAQAASTTINTLGEEIDIVSFGSTLWQVTNRRVPSNWEAVTMTPQAGFGTTTSGSYFYRREGDSAHFKGYFVAGTLGAGSAAVALPTNYVIDTTKMPGGLKNNLGTWEAFTNSGVVVNTFGSQTAPNIGGITYNATNTQIQFAGTGLSSLYHDDSANQLAGNTFGFAFDFVVPISGWNG